MTWPWLAAAGGVTLLLLWVEYQAGFAAGVKAGYARGLSDGRRIYGREGAR